MKKSIATLCAALFALLSSSVVLAATVTITPSTANPTIGTQFTLTVSGAGFPDTVGATLKLNFDPAVVRVLAPAASAGIVLAPGSPFTGGISYNGTDPFLPLNNFSVLAPTVGTLPSGSFNAFQIIFTAIAAGNANIVLVDDQADFSWTDATTFAAIPVTYTQATVTVAGAPAEANISVTDSVVPGNDLAVAFGNVTVATTNTQTVTVTNTGGANLVITAIASANPLAAPFSITNDTCSNQTLTPTMSCTLSVIFNPSALGLASDAFNIPSNDPDSPAVTVAVNGTGTAPQPNISVTDSITPVNDRVIPFGDRTINTFSSETVTVTNTGAAALTIDAIAPPPAAPFSITADNCSNSSLAPASTCAVTVVFSPVTVGTFSGSFDITSNDPDDATVPINLSGAGVAVPAPGITVTDAVLPFSDQTVPFGNITQGAMSTQIVTVTNSGSADLVIGQVGSSVNPLAAPFSVSPDNCSGATVAPLASCTFQLVFTPTALGMFTDSLDVPSNAGASVTVNLSGTGVAVMVPDITVTDNTAPANDFLIPFGTVDVTDFPSEVFVVVTNDGSGDLVLGTIGAGNPLAPPFRIVTTHPANTCSSAPLAPTQTCAIVVEFDPSAEGDFIDSFSIPSNDLDEPTVTMNVSGTGIQSSTVVIDGGSSAVDPWSLAFLGGLPFLRRRRKAAAMKLAMAAAAGVLAAPAAMADDAWDWNYDGVYLGAGVIGTSLKTSRSFNSTVQSQLGLLGGSFEDFAVGGQLYAGWMFTNRWGMEIRWSDSRDGNSDILRVDTGGARTRIGEIEASIDGFTLYGVGNWPVAERWDLFGKLGYTRQKASFEGAVDGGEGGPGPASFAFSDNDVGPAAALGARWRFAHHFASTVEAEYLGVDFDNKLDKPWRVGLNVEYWFGGQEVVAAAPVVAAAVVAAEPTPPPVAPPAGPQDGDKDGILDGDDQCADTPSGDRVSSAGCSCELTRQLTFKSDSSAISDADKAVLDEMADSLTRLKFVSGVIEGHTDSVGSPAYNQGLSERRAQIAADYLASKGIASDRLQVVGRGETDPIADNKTAEGRAQNRRVVAKRTDCDK